MNPETPKKSVPKKGRKRKGQETSQFCRICYRPFVISYGNFPTSRTGYISTENIFTVPQKKGLTKSLAWYLEFLGFHLDLGEQFSTRVCSPCGTKVRTAAATVEVLKTNLNRPAPCIGVQNERSKRMSNSPHQTQQSKILRNSGSPNKSGAKRSLSLGGMQNENVHPEERSASEGISRSLGCEVFQSNTVKELRIYDELTTLDHEKQEKTELTVLVSDPNPEFTEGGSKEDQSVEVKDKTPKDPVLRSLIKNTLNRNWKTVVNILLLKVKEAKPFVQQAIRKVTGKEIGVLCKTGKSILKNRSAKELIDFSNAKVAAEVSKECPIWNSCLLGACGIWNNEDDPSNTNSVAVATAVVAKRRNKRMSAFAYRVSSILMHSGAKEADFTRLNRLGLCMSHKETLVKQKEMGKHFDEKVKSWRGDAILRRNTVAMMEEFVAIQQEESALQLTAALIKDCTHYSDDAFKLCSKVIADKWPGDLTKDSFEDAKLEVKKGPLYRFLYFSVF